MAASLGSIGGVLLILMGFIGYKLHQRRKARNNDAAADVGFSNRPSIRSDSSDSSDNAGVAIIARDATYNTVTSQ